MAGSSEDGRRRHRRCPADLRDHAEPPEEGELVPGCDDDDSDVNTDDYYNNHRYYSSSDSDETTSDCNYARSASVVPASYGAVGGPSSAATAAAVAANNNGNVASSSSPVPAPAAVLACPICGKEFRSRKAVCGHMKVHQQGTIGRRHEQQQQQQGIGKKNKGIKRNAAVAAGWGGTGKRGCPGRWSKPASPNAGAQSDQSMAIVVANPSIVLQPKPLAFAAPNPLPVRMESATPNHYRTGQRRRARGSLPSAEENALGKSHINPSSAPVASTVTNASDESSSAKPMRSDAMETVVVGAANPPTEAAVHLADAARAPPSPPRPPAEVHVTSVHQQPIELSPTPPPAAAEEERVQLPPVHHPHPIAPLPLTVAVAGRQNPDGYSCPQCGAWFPTHQGLGGHVAGHKTRELAAAPCRRDAKPEKKHECKICGAVFTAGVQLGGHMRKHYTGAPIVPKKKPQLAIQLPLPPPAEQGALEPAPRPAVAGRLRLFGVDIEAAGAQTPAAQEEGSSATHQAPSAASTGGEQHQQ